MAEMSVLLIPRKDPSQKSGGGGGGGGEAGNGTEYQKSNSNCGIAVFVDIHNLAQKLVCANA